MTTSEEIEDTENQKRPGKLYPQRMVEKCQQLCPRSNEGQRDKSGGTCETES